MRSGIKILLAGLMIASVQEQRNTRIITTNPNKKKSSNKASNKKHKAKPNSQYKNSKPIKSKSVTQFRNKSNI